MKSGPRPTPVAEHRRKGTFRAARHTDRADSVEPQGTPVKPALGDVESALWEQVVPDLVARKLVGESDTAELAAMCELWGLYRAAYAEAKAAPCDKEIRCAVTGYWTAFDKAAAKFGLTTCDRSRLKVPSSKAQDESDPLEQLKVVGAQAG